MVGRGLDATVIRLTVHSARDEAVLNLQFGTPEHTTSSSSVQYWMQSALPVSVRATTVNWEFKFNSVRHLAANSKFKYGHPAAELGSVFSLNLH